jgi:hypothetical protein
MWRPWSKPLEWLGRLRLHTGSWVRADLSVGDPQAVDARGTADWKRYLSPEALFDVWGPLPGSPWEPFHTVPLFAALDRVQRKGIGPAPPPPPGAGTPHPGTAVLPEHARPGAPPPVWLTRDTLTIVDLPGPASVAAGAWLAGHAQPVCTFDNWPHPRGVLRPEHTLAAMLRWASTVAEARQQLTPESPPVWLCDRGRLGGPPGRPGEFDNRYFLDDSTLPGSAFLRAAGITRVVYLTGRAEAPLYDLAGPFVDFVAAGVPVFLASVEEAALELYRYRPPEKPPPIPEGGFSRSSAGGFGTEVPQPSSGSSG